MFSGIKEMTKNVKSNEIFSTYRSNFNTLKFKVIK